jgi:hypothetical protein
MRSSVHHHQQSGRHRGQCWYGTALRSGSLPRKLKPTADDMVMGLKVLSILLVAIAMATALAHALELPGKMRLPKDVYFKVQSIYYPGFTIGGLSEPAGLIAIILLLVFTPFGSAAWWFTLSALFALLAMHGVYWILTHPVNRFWVQGFQLGGFGARFFGFGLTERTGETPEQEWTALRDRWEFSHVVRAALGAAGLALLAAAVAA